MPDRRRRTAFRHPLPERTSLLMRERQSSTGSSSSSSSSSGSAGTSGSSGQADDNPFAAPPENRPDQPWQPRRPSNTGNGNGNGGGGGNGQGDGDGSAEGGSSGDRPVWGGQWSSRQPGRQSGGFGGRPGGQGGQNGQGGPEGSPGGMRWDPTDPAQRRARYALLSGMWAFFFALFDFPEIALLLGALAVYWAISSLRAKPKSASTAAADGSGQASGSTQATGAAASGRVPAPGSTPGAPGAPGGGRQQTTAAVSGLVTALLALSIVATTFTVQLVYRDYYTCVNDALTKSGQLSCNDQLPKPLEPFFGVKN
ncbi:hypothetical protein OG978_24890 [Streptomyces sp. NBC_01591]|uniref:hypothetical protein n=1 Tax=Streptomyces sp. NBC_01591 TaxID=2975888 RepID=UPI002DD999A8|nr:hypothetical protein [Streptomyces sp. NBC_01591]WSD70327.1 hypothetical protein OG978_24890 [Streptomyces sp. NBC_01591]